MSCTRRNWGTIALLFTAFGCACSRAGHDSDSPPPIPSPQPWPSASRNQAIESLAPVVKQVMPSVVSISSTRVVKNPAPFLPFEDPFFRRFFGPQSNAPREFKEHGLGSGVILEPDMVVTNNHVVEGAQEIKVTAVDKREFKATLVGADAPSDLAILRLPGKPKGLKPIVMGDSARLELGDVVLAIGYPFGVGETVTMGIVSGLRRTNLGIERYENFIQTDAAINPGNSGGALVNTAGQLVGINTAILSQSGGYMGIGFAIPSDMARPILASLLRHGKVVRGYLGVSIQDVTPELATALKLPSTAGVLVSGVEPNTPGAKAGLVRGDVILKLNGNPVNSSSDLRNQVAAAGANARVPLEVWRSGQLMTITAELGELPSSIGPAEPNVPAPGQGGPGTVPGLSLQPLNPQLRSQYDIPSSVTSGLVITRVQAGSSAGSAGLRPGDVVLEINQKKVTTVDQFTTEWNRSGNQVLLLVQRGEASIFLIINK